MNDDQLLTITEVAAMLRAPVATLRYWRHLGTGPRSFRIGRRVLYTREDVHAFVEKHPSRRRRRRPRCRVRTDRVPDPPGR